jgi:hypothetical protein
VSVDLLVLPGTDPTGSRRVRPPGASSGNRTPDLLFTKEALWPAELRRLGATRGNRTPDLPVTLGTLCLLSYGDLGPVAGIRTPTFCLEGRHAWPLTSLPDKCSERDLNSHVRKRPALNGVRLPFRHPSMVRTTGFEPVWAFARSRLGRLLYTNFRHVRV